MSVTPHDDEIEHRLQELLAEHPDATVFVVEPGEYGDPDPSHPGLDGLPIRAGSVVGPVRALDLLHPSSRPSALTAVDRVGEVGVLEEAALLSDGRPAVSYLFDTLGSRKLYIGVQLPTGEQPRSSVATVSHDLVPTRVSHMATDGLGRVLWVDDRTERALADAGERLVGTTSIEAVHPDDATNMRVVWASMLASPEIPQRARYRRRQRDGWRWFEATLTNHLDDPDHPEVRIELVDISTEMAAEEEVRRRERLLHRLAEALPQAIMQLDRSGTVVHANQRAVEMLGNQPVSVADVVAAAYDADRESLGAAIDAALAGADCDVELSLQVAGADEPIVAELVLRGVSDDDGRPDGALCCISDVTERARLRANLELRASFDTLTGLLNRESVMMALEAALGSGDHGVGVLFVDLDGFKEVNDRHGHAVGDQVLTAVADRLGTAVRGRDVVGRLGGDEFLVVCHDVGSPADAVAAAERVSAALDPDKVGDDRFRGVRASIGVAWSDAGLSGEALMALADEAMYESKREGRGRAVLANR